jgi:hypothetical protein
MEVRLGRTANPATFPSSVNGLPLGDALRVGPLATAPLQPPPEGIAGFGWGERGFTAL